MAGSRKVGKGRGSVYAGGRTYLEGAEIPADVEVGAHVFTDVEPVEGNETVEIVRPIGPDGPVVTEAGAAPVPTGTVSETPPTDTETAKTTAPLAKKAAAKRSAARKSSAPRKAAAKKAAASPSTS